MAELSSDLQASISALGTQHTNLVQAVRDYTGGSVASATNDLLASVTEVTATIKSTERNLIGLVDRSNDGKLPSMLLDFASQTYFTGLRGLEEAVDPHKYLNVSRSTSKWVMGPQGKLVEVPPNTLAYEYDPVTGESKGVLIEESRTNLALWSEDLTSYSAGRLSLEPTSQSETSAFVATVSEEGWVYSALWGSIQYASGASYVTSVFAKAGSGVSHVAISLRGETFGSGLDANSATFRLADGEVTQEGSNNVNAFSVPCGGGWFRLVHVSGAAAAVGSSPLITLLNQPTFSSSDIGLAVGSYCYLRGTQLEEGSTPTSYIPTTDSSVTRAADNVYRTLGDEFNPKEGTFVIEYKKEIGVPVGFLLAVNSTIGLAHLRVVQGFSGTISVSMDSLGSVTFQSMSDGANKVALSYRRASGLVASANGEPAQEILAVADRIATDLQIGQLNGDTRPAVGHYAHISYIPYALSETELQELTANG